MKSHTRALLFGLIVTAISVFYLFGGSQLLTLEFVQTHLNNLRIGFRDSPVLFTCAFVGVYLFLTTLSIPGSIVLTLLSGAIFGVQQGTFLVIVSTTLGACFAFLMSRYLFRDYFHRRFQAQFLRMNHRVKREGIPYLFILRMIPVSPYVVINIVMGLTEMRLWNFAWVTYLGMLPGTFLYVLAGKEIASITKISDILSWEIALGLTALGVVPPVLRKVLNQHSRRFAHD